MSMNNEFQWLCDINLNGRKKMITINCIIAVGIGMVVEHFTGIFGKVFGFVTGMFSK